MEGTLSLFDWHPAPEAPACDLRAPSEPAIVDRAARENGARATVEVSGGLNERNIAAYSLAGVDVLSVGSLTHSVTACDFSLLIARKGTSRGTSKKRPRK